MFSPTVWFPKVRERDRVPVDDNIFDPLGRNQFPVKCNLSELQQSSLLVEQYNTSLCSPLLPTMIRVLFAIFCN